MSDLESPNNPKILDGLKLSKIKEQDQLIKSRKFKQLFSRQPSLAVIIVGDNPASQVYVKNKIKKCETIEISSLEFPMSASSTQEEIASLIIDLNNDPLIDGILLQMPLPPGINSQVLLDLISPKKDVDGFHPNNLGYLMLGLEASHPLPCTPAGVIELLDHYQYDYKGKDAVMVGASNIVGTPLSLMLLNRHATVTICHSSTKDLAFHAKQADLLLVATGVANLIKPEMIKPGAWIVDIGISRKDNKLVGDVAPLAYQKSSYYTPVPGGIGPMTISKLIDNCLMLAFKRAKV